MPKCFPTETFGQVQATCPYSSATESERQALAFLASMTRKAGEGTVGLGHWHSLAYRRSSKPPDREHGSTAGDTCKEKWEKRKIYYSSLENVIIPGSEVEVDMRSRYFLTRFSQQQE